MFVDYSGFQEDNNVFTNFIITLFRRFHDLAQDLLGECYNNNESLTRELIKYDYCADNKKVKQRVSSLKIAASIYNEEFVAHSSCQSLLNFWWGGALATGEERNLKVSYF